MSRELRAVIIDDSRSYQLLLQKVLEEIGDIKVVGKASNGHTGLRMIELYQPDFITLDVEMPIMDGLETLKKLKATKPDISVIMVSALTKQGAQVTMRALEAGAFDFIAKPAMETREASHQALIEQLSPKVDSLKKKKRFFKNEDAPRTLTSLMKHASSMCGREEKADCIKKQARNKKEPVSIIGLGISTGGPNALKKVIPQLPGSLKAPILIVQHMPPIFTQVLADSLNQQSELTVKEAVDGDIVSKGFVYIAPGGKQMKVIRQDALLKIHITDDPPEKNCKPSVDYLFRSLASQCRGGAMGVIMTGMGRDGTLGLKLMKRHGSLVIAQNEETCTVFGMPMEAIKSGLADMILPLEKIADGIQDALSGKY
ncbi:MAG: chemotaxis response regulator protein-glutamate methylesterase [Acidobacteria bacterium]|nr:MAG: chemotaxis response regulator protein-glutamate methylesterase [Acidobacteriota bacterium]